MILVKIHYFCLMLLQKAPPPPGGTLKMGPTPVGDEVPLDVNAWVLLVLAMILIVYKTMPTLKKVP